MRAGQGSVPNAAGSFGELWQELAALRELAVVLQERLDAFRGLMLHADADGGPCTVVRVRQEQGKDPEVDMLYNLVSPRADSGATP